MYPALVYFVLTRTYPFVVLGEEMASGDASRLIVALNKLRGITDSLQDDPLQLPSIVVVGSQSAGKSSVLEAFVGRDFLPRGADIVTRRPLVLQLVHTPQSQEEYGEFAHVPSRRFYDFGQMRREIEEETNRKCGVAKAISAEPILLTIRSPKVVTLALVDLPGLTKIPVGNQPANIARQIRDLVVRYAQQPNSIILAVSAANVDIANSESLNLAAELDPDGERTIGVLTKLDLMDRGTDAAEILAGRKVPLRLGFVGVVNRSQHDTRAGRSLQESLLAEEKYFRAHPAYAPIAHRCGTANLSRELNQLLVSSIHAQLPTIRMRVHEQLDQAQRRMLLYGEPVQSRTQKMAALLQQIDAFAAVFAALIDGRADLGGNEIVGGARIASIFRDRFQRELEETDPCAGLTTQDLRMALRNCGGAQQSLFIPDAAFETLVKRQLERLRAPSRQCAQLVSDEVTKIVVQAQPRDLVRFPELQRRIGQLAAALQKEGLGPTVAMIDSLIDIELAHINTKHRDFVPEAVAYQATQRHQTVLAASKQTGAGSGGNLLGMLFGALGVSGGGEPVQRPRSATQPAITDGTAAAITSTLAQVTDRESAEIEILRALIIAYFVIVRRTIEDAVPKAIMCYLVNFIKRELHRRLRTELIRDDAQLDELLREDPAVDEQRRRARERVDVFTRAAAAMSEFGDL